MSRPQEPHRPFFPFGNPFRMISPKGSHPSPKILALLTTFEETLAGRIKKLKPAVGEDFISLSWMKSAMESLCGIHMDVKTLINALELPVCDWEDKWIDVYLDNSVKLLDICNALSSEILRMKHGDLFLQHTLHILGGSAPDQFVRASSSLDGWKQHISSKNRRLDNCFSAMDGLTQTLDLLKIKNSAKGKVLMRALYGVKAITLLVCSVFAATFSGSSKKLMELQVRETCLWAEAFTDLQAFVNTEVTNTNNRRAILLQELDTVDTGVKKLHPILQNGKEDPIDATELQDSTSNLEKSVEKLSQGLDLLAKEVDKFFQILVTSRDALLNNLRFTNNASDKLRANKKVESLIVR